MIDVDQQVRILSRHHGRVVLVEKRAVKRFLAILAAAFLLVRPFCEAQARDVPEDAPLHSGHAVTEHGLGDTAPHGHTPCCAHLDEGAVAELGDPAAILLPAGAQPAIASAVWRLAPRARAMEAEARPPPDIPFGPPSYYARSARILR